MTAIAPYAACLALCLLAASTGMLFPPGEWYAGLRKPPGTPPDLAFPVVWTVLYVCMGVAAGMAWRASRDRRVLAPWLVQLALNALWTPLFFGLHRMALGFLVIVLLWTAILVTILVFRRVRPAAAWLLAPYLAWVTLAGWLNAGLWWLNR